MMKKDIEYWKNIYGYEKIYQVSNFGRIKRLPTVIQRRINKTIFNQNVPGKILSVKGKCAKVYPMINLCKNGKFTPRTIHSIVAETFLGVLPLGQHVCHIDGNPLNSHVSNLRYDTPTGNASDRIKHGTDAKGINNPRAILSESQVRKIKKQLLKNSIKTVANNFNLNYRTIQSIYSGKNWKHITI